MNQDTDPEKQPDEDSFLNDCLSAMRDESANHDAINFSSLHQSAPLAGQSQPENSEHSPPDASAEILSEEMNASMTDEGAQHSAEPTDDQPDDDQQPKLVSLASSPTSVSDLNSNSDLKLSSGRSRSSDVHPVHLATSTFLSLVMVLALLLVARLLVPSLVEQIRYGWYRGQLRAEYELSQEQLRSISLDSLADVSKLVSHRTGPSVVHINLLPDPETVNRFQAILGNRVDPALQFEGQGSGFIIDSDGHILTNHHVVDGVGSIEVTLGDGRRLAAAVVGTDPLTDLAVLKIDAGNLMAIEWGDSEDVVVGTPVWAVGSPFGLQQTVTFGIISGKHRVDFRSAQTQNEIPGGTPYGDLMQSDVALNPGNSGGPLVNSLGQVVGVNAAILGETFRGVSFSIPSKVAQEVARQLIKEGEVARGWLGVQLVDLPRDERFNDDGTPRPGVRVTRFPPGHSSPARRAGMRIGDIIIQFEGTEVPDMASLMQQIGETPVGQEVEVVVLRDSEEIALMVKLDRRDESVDAIRRR